MIHLSALLKYPILEFIMRPMDTVLDPESIGEDGLPIMPAPPAWYWVLLGRIVVLTIVGYSLWYYQFESLFTIIVLFILVVPMEKIFPRHKGQNAVSLYTSPSPRD